MNRRTWVPWLLGSMAGGTILVACAGTAPSEHDAQDSDGGGGISLGEPPGQSPDAGAGSDASNAGQIDAESSDAPNRFVQEVVSFTPGTCAGFGASQMPGIVEGPPVGAGDQMGSLDVVSLGEGGELVVRVGDIIDGPGPDFIVFENAFYVSGDPTKIAADLGQISVSEDGITWHEFPCTPGATPPFGTCAGWRPVYSAPSNDISPFDAEHAGGDPFDLADLGVPRAAYVRIRDRASATCPDGGGATNLGFDLDAIAVLHGAGSE